MGGTSTRRQHPPDAPGAYVPLDRTRFRLVLAGLMSAMLLSALDHTVVVTALPIIVKDLGGAESLSAVVTAYMLASALAALWFGQIADTLGRRPTLLACVAVFVLASALCGLAQSMAYLIVLRAVQGIGAGGLMTLSQTVIADLVEPRERGRYQGYVLSVFGAASVAGPFVGGLLADHFSWRAIFLVNVPVGLVALWMLAKALPRGAFGLLGRRASLASSIALSVPAVLLLAALSLVGEGAEAWLTTTMMVASGVLAGVFVLVERRVRVPLFASRALRARLYVTSNIGGLTVHAAMMGAVVLLPLYLQGVRGMTAAETGIMMLPQMVSWLTSTLLCGVAISRWGRVKPFAVAGASLNAAGLSMMLLLRADTSLWLLGVALMVFGTGQGLALQSLAVATQADVPLKEMGQATGFASFTRSVGAVLGVALSGAVFGVALGAGEGLMVAFLWAVGISIPLAVVAAVASIVMPEVSFTSGGRVSAAALTH